MKVVFNEKDLKEELEKMEKGESILFYDKEIKSQEDRFEFQKYLSRLIMINRHSDFKINGGIIFSKKEKSLTKKQHKNFGKAIKESLEREKE